MSSLSASSGMDTLIDEEILSLGKKAKELATEIGWVRTQKKREYVPQLLALQEHKSVDVRRRAITTLGELGSKEILEQLKEWQANEADRTAWVALEGVIDKIQRKIDGVDDDSTKVLTVSEALKVVKQLIGTTEYIIEGELSEVRPVRNLYFFGLKDKVDVRINCMLVSYNISNIGFALNEGLQVRVHGLFKMSKDSRIYFDVKKISLTGEGELLRNLKMLDQKLQMEGLYDPLRKRQPVRLPERILLLASPTSAAIKDFTKVLGERRRGIQIYMLPIKTQGAGAEYEILQTIKSAQVYIKEKNIQTVVITRGGGSQDDLQLFNSENVVRAIHGIDAPVIVAIGHERDVTLAEKAADVRASTPSNAAELASWSTVEAQSEINIIMNRLVDLFKDRKNEYFNVTQILSQKIYRRVQLMVQSARNTANQSDQAFRTLIFGVRRDVDQSVRSISFKANNLVHETQRSIPMLGGMVSNKRFELQYMGNQIQQNLSSIQTKLSNFVAIQRLEFNSTIKTIELSDPKLTLERGYAMVKQEKKIISGVTHIDHQKPVEIQMSDGSISFKTD